MIYHLRILGKTYAVTFVTPTPLYSAVKGEINCLLGTIHIDSSMSADHIAEALIHEAIHAMDYDMQLELTERQVHALGAGILMLLNDNPGLRDMLASGSVETTMPVRSDR